MTNKKQYKQQASYNQQPIDDDSLCVQKEDQMGWGQDMSLTPAIKNASYKQNRLLHFLMTEASSRPQLQYAAAGDTAPVVGGKAQRRRGNCPLISNARENSGKKGWSAWEGEI